MSPEFVLQIAAAGGLASLVSQLTSFVLSKSRRRREAKAGDIDSIRKLLAESDRLRAAYEEVARDWEERYRQMRDEWAALSTAHQDCERRVLRLQDRLVQLEHAVEAKTATIDKLTRRIARMEGKPQVDLVGDY